jgi:hypothetical protein
VPGVSGHSAPSGPGSPTEQSLNKYLRASMECNPWRLSGKAATCYGRLTAAQKKSAGSDKSRMIRWVRGWLHSTLWQWGVLVTVVAFMVHGACRLQGCTVALGLAPTACSVTSWGVGMNVPWPACLPPCAAQGVHGLRRGLGDLPVRISCGLEVPLSTCTARARQGVEQCAFIADGECQTAGAHRDMDLYYVARGSAVCFLAHSVSAPSWSRLPLALPPLQATLAAEDQTVPASSPECSPEVFQLGVHPTDPASFLGLHPELDPDAFLQKITVLGAHTKRSNLKGGEATGLDGSHRTALSAYEAAAIAVVIAILFALVGNDCEERQFKVRSFGGNQERGGAAEVVCVWVCGWGGARASQRFQATKQLTWFCGLIFPFPSLSLHSTSR